MTRLGVRGLPARVAAAVAGAVVLAACSLGGGGSQARSAPSSTPAPASPSTLTASPSPTSPSATSSAAGPRDWSEVFSEVSTGVVRLDVDLCDSSIATGTGFLVSPTLVATVAHVVDGAERVRVTASAAGRATSGTVVGFDLSRDLALVRTDTPLDGHVFDLQTQQPAIGTEIGIIGFPLARSMQLTTGHISSTHDRRTVQHVGSLTDVLLTDGVQNPGNSGGPWVTRDGRVVALAESGPPADPTTLSDASVQRAQGNNGGVSTADAAAAFAQWSDDPTPVATCGASEQSRQEAAQETLDYYFWELNQSDYSSAYAQLDPANHPLSALDSFIEGVKSSQDSARDGDPDSGPYYEVVGGDETGDENTVEVRFRSRQDGAHGPEGLTCADWHLRYSFVRSDGLELIHESSPVDGEPRYVACPAE